MEEMTYPKRMTKEFQEFYDAAHWMVVQDKKTLREVQESPENILGVSLDTLQQWSIKYKWMEERKKNDQAGLTIPKMSYNLVYSEFLKLSQRQGSGDILSKNDVEKLEKLVKIYKQTGLPFGEQVANVMKVFLRFIDGHMIRDSEEHILFISLIKDFIADVEGGFIHLEGQM